MEDEPIYDGCCKFCGQVVQYDESVLRKAEGDPDIAAKLICDCTQAKSFQRRRENIKLGVSRVDEIVGKGSERPLPDETIHFPHRAVTHMVYGRMTKVAVQVSGAEKVTLAVTNKGIKVSREVKSTRNSEVEMLI